MRGRRRSDCRCVRGTGRKPSAVTSNEIIAALRPSCTTARVVAESASRAPDRARPCLPAGRRRSRRHGGSKTLRPRRSWRDRHGRRRRSCSCVTIARAPVRLSATVNSACRHSSGSSATTSPARCAASTVSTNSTVLGSCTAITELVGKPGFDEMRRQRRDRPIGLREGQALRRLAGDARLVEGIEQRRRVRLARQDPSKQSVERRRCVGLDHGITSVGRSRPLPPGFRKIARQRGGLSGRSIRFQRAIHCS